MVPKTLPEVDAILTAAAELFERKGYDDVSVEAIAERAGVGRSTVFSRYVSKQGILVGIVEAFLYQFPLFLAQFDLSADAVSDEAVAPPPRRRGRRLTTPALSIAVAAATREDGGVLRLVAALREFTRQWGPLARVALAAKDLPWITRGLSGGHALFRNGLRLYLGPRATTRLHANVVADLLKHACAGHGNGNGNGNGDGDVTGHGHGGAVDEIGVINLLSMLAVGRRAADDPLRLTPPLSGATGTDPLRYTPINR